MPSAPLQISDYSQLSEAWAAAANRYLEQLEDHTSKQLKIVGPRSEGVLAVVRAVSLLTKQKRSELGSLLAASLSLPPEHCKCCAQWAFVDAMGKCCSRSLDMQHGRFDRFAS
jgi:hypothetical protein